MENGLYVHAIPIVDVVADAELVMAANDQNNSKREGRCHKFSVSKKNPLSYSDIFYQSVGNF